MHQAVYGEDPLPPARPPRRPRQPLHPPRSHVCNPAGRCSSLSAPALKSTGFADTDWPQWRGPNRDGVSKETGLLKTWPKEGPKLVWTFEDAGIGFSSFAVVGNTLYTMGSQDEANGDKEFVLAVDTESGQGVMADADRHVLQERFWGGGPRSTPTIDGDKLYALGANGDLVCLNRADGAKVWAKNLVKDFGGNVPGWGYSESVLIDGENLICHPGRRERVDRRLEQENGRHGLAMRRICRTPRGTRRSS